MTVVEMLYDPDPQDRDPERVRTKPSMWQKLTSTAPERYAHTLATTFGRSEEQERRPRVFELIMTLQNYEEQLPPVRTAVSAISRVED